MEHNAEKILNLCLRAGDIMLKSGAETSRVEETIDRFGRTYGAREVESFVTPTGIFISVRTDEQVLTGILRIHGIQSVNLNKVHVINDISRRFERGQIDKQRVEELLKEIESKPGLYRLRYQHLAAGLSSGAFAVLFGGSWPEFCVGAFAGWVSNTMVGKLADKMPNFLSVFFAALAGVIVSTLGILFSVATRADAAIIGAVIPLVPGLSLTNAVRDLMAGELISGVARASEAALTAFAIAVAVALVLSFGFVPGVPVS